MNSLASYWTSNVEQFRRSPESFLAARNITAHSFVVDILKCSDKRLVLGQKPDSNRYLTREAQKPQKAKVFSNENLPENLKLQMLLMLQEKASSLFLEARSVECAVYSIKELFAQPLKGMLEVYGNQTISAGTTKIQRLEQARKDILAQSSTQSQIYLSQILVTGTVILVTSKMVETNQDIFVDFVGVLTDVIEMVNNPCNLLVRKSACECLWELEMMYPGLFQAKLDHLYAQCAVENSHIFQSYMVLFATVLHHAMEHLLQVSANKLDDNCLNNLLTSRTEPLKPLYLPREALEQFLPVTYQATGFSSKSLTLPGNVDTKEIKRAISFLMDSISFLNIGGIFHLMCQLMQCVKIAGLSPNGEREMLWEHELQASISTAFRISP
ncbi:PREDICTED: AP-5 complex subunit beta-1-like [Acropora digitifera]|uniref:AP-5 complex subunit beta-1-like n=1 Tax=Acropora digitifera TaxID=70779 RepID=UPI00077A44FF|nr:PREDICTED: AP-5 complex subunit beta-1-like [Acropora digitifera]